MTGTATDRQIELNFNGGSTVTNLFDVQNSPDLLLGVVVVFFPVAIAVVASVGLDVHVTVAQYSVHFF